MAKEIIAKEKSYPTPDISVVITAHNEVGKIGFCLKNLARIGMNGVKSWEVIVVDDRSDDDTGSKALEVGLPQLRMIRIDSYKNRALSARQIALDRGIRESRGKVILLTDADATVPMGWGLNLSAPILARAADAVAGELVYDKGGLFAALLNLDAQIFFSYSRFLRFLGGTPGGVFGNFAFRRDLYHLIGGFENLGFSLIEDHTFIHWINARGYHVKILPGLPVKVKPCSTLRDFLDRTFRVTSVTRSVLSVSIWLLFLTLPVFFLLALTNVWSFIPFLIRYGLSLSVFAILLLQRRAWRLIPLLCFYEFLAQFFGLWAVGHRLIRKKVNWGGITYDLRRE